jgi:hypothetical protein|tara:strand:+ start:314 stop:595 length:282 start_codon:yes stop_codon:yes gene_type:complete
MSKKNELTTINNVDISPLIREVVEYSKSQKSVGDLEQLISKVPAGNSPDWKLISGVLCNAVVEWASQNSEGRDLIQHIQSDVGYILKRMGLTQ